MPLVEARASFYGTLSDQSVDLPPVVKARLLRAASLYGREVVHVPLGLGVASALLFSTMEMLGVWAVFPAAGAGVSVVFSGLWVKFQVATPALPQTLRADVAQACEDFRSAAAELARPSTPVNVIMAARSFEAPMDEVMRTILHPDVPSSVREDAMDEALAIGARVWALAEVERERQRVIETIVGAETEQIGPGSEERMGEALRVPLDFSEIEAVGTTVARESAELSEPHERD